MTRQTLLLILNAYNAVPAGSGGGASVPVVASANDSTLHTQVLTALKLVTGANAPGTNAISI